MRAGGEAWNARVRVNTETGCWEWVGARSPEGYGRFRGPDQNMHYAHRASYEMASGVIPEGLVIDHLCRVRHCVNPDHLEAVTHQVNILRGASPTAVAVQTNHCCRGHEFTPENTYHLPDGSARRCRTCTRIVKRAWVASRAMAS